MLFKDYCDFQANNNAMIVSCSLTERQWRVKLTLVFRSLCNSCDIKTKMS